MSRATIRGALVAGLLAAAGVAGAQPFMDEGRKLFNTGAPPLPACALCHTLQHAGAVGTIGPDLDDLKPDAGRVEKAVRNGMGPMPAFASLSDEQVRLLARYVVQATGAGK